MNKIFFILFAVAVSSSCTSKFYVGPRTADCAIGSRSECYLIKYSLKENWMLIAEDIVGFDYEEDYIYQIKVKKIKVKDEFNNIRDGYELVEILSKEKYVPKKNQQLSMLIPGSSPASSLGFTDQSQNMNLAENEIILTIIH